MLKSNPIAFEEHCCDGHKIELNKFLQIGSGVGRSLLVVGESPAANWINSGRAFFTIDGKTVPTGKNFLVNLKQIDENLDLENISFTELSKCFIGANRNKLYACARQNWPHFIEQLNYVQPKLIILLGQKTTEIFNLLAGISLTVGQLQLIKIADKQYNMLPLYHPSPLNAKRIQNVSFIDGNIKEIRKLLEI